MIYKHGRRRGMVDNDDFKKIEDKSFLIMTSH
jgi:hypothetical protein